MCWLLPRLAGAAANTFCRSAGLQSGTATSPDRRLSGLYAAPTLPEPPRPPTNRGAINVTAIVAAWWRSARRS